MKNLEKHLITVSLIAAGVVAAGYAMYQFRTNTFIGEARKGFNGA